MFRPTGFNDLAGKRVGIFGYGIEGRAAAARLAQHAELVIVDDSADLGPEVLQTSQGGLEALAKCDVVLKSPGISPYRPEVAELAKTVTVTSALNLWMHEIDRDRVIGVTGTKGKSTTTALIAFILNALGEKAQALGNIGLPPYDPSVDTSEGWLVLEISSFQARDLKAPPLALVLTSLGADHTDWHGSVENYHRDKLSIARLTPNPHVFLSPAVDKLGLIENAQVVEPDSSDLTDALGLIGDHNRSNVALALSATAWLMGLDAKEMLPDLIAAANSFAPLPGRLNEIARREHQGQVIRFIDDGLATAALPTVAALSAFPSEDIALIVGGFDRGIDYRPLIEAVSARSKPTSVITIGKAGERIERLFLELGEGNRVIAAGDLKTAVAIGSRVLNQGGLVLFSPAAPSFDHYKNWEDRSAAFCKFAQEAARIDC